MAVSDRETLPIGTEVVVYGQPLELGVIESGPEADLLTGIAVCRIRRENGEIVKRAPLIVARRSDFTTSWHVWKDSHVIAGGPGITRERVDRYAAEHGGDVLYGWPAGHPAAQHSAS